MPNGGSDCCGTCWFNSKNKGEAGYEHAKDRGPDFCEIRELSIRNPFYTYCGNHPQRRPDRDPCPIGPVFVADEMDTRKLWKPSPDREDIRLHLLSLLSGINEKPASEYPLGHYTDETVVWQLGEFQETRAVAEIERIVSFNPSSSENGPFGRTREELVERAREALEKIRGRPA